MTASSEKVDFTCPSKFLNYVTKHLDENGGIGGKSIQDIVDLMKESKDKLVPKCMLLTIISVSSVDMQTKLCESGIWNILFQWLQDGLKNDATCFIVEILKLYLKLPITFDNLKSNACPKLIKKLTKTGNEEIMSIATSIYDKWKQVVQDNTNKDVVPAKKIKLEEKPEGNNTVGEIKKKLSTVKVKTTTVRTAGIEEDGESKVKKIDKTSAPSLDELHQKIDKRKVIELHESKNFINSLMSSSAPPKKKKKRQENQIANKSQETITTEEVVTADTSAPIIEMPKEKPKKRVSWAPSESIQTVHYFELDENERVNVNRVSIEEMRKKEKLMEKQNVSRKFVEENEDEAFVEKWVKPVKVAGVIDLSSQVKSAERQIQQDRERKVLKILYFAKVDIPNTPTEPDNESYDVKEPDIIPLIEVVNSKQKSSPNQQVPVPKKDDNQLIIIEKRDGNERQASLRPDVANLLKSMTQVPGTSNNSVPPNNEIEDQNKQNSNDPALKSKLINFIRNRYPDVDPEKMSCEELYNLLVPMREQLIREGINLPDNYKMPMSAPFSQPRMNIPPPPPFIPQQWYGHEGPPGPDGFPRLPPPPPFPHMLGHNMQPPIQYAQPPPRNIQPPPPRPPYNGNTGPRHNFNQNRHPPVCKFFANSGYCRQGNNCSFSHVTPDYHKNYNQNRH